MPDSPAHPPPHTRPHWIVWTGLAVVLAAAAVLSFDALRGLAEAVRISDRLAWLLPVAVDAGAAVSCATWLGGRTTETAARFAGRMTWSLLAVTVVGNAAALGMHAHDVTPPWWVAVLVGTIPPAVVGSTVHLVVLLIRRTDLETGRQTGPDRTAEPAEPAKPDHDEPGEWTDPWDRWSAEAVPAEPDQAHDTPEPAVYQRSDRGTAERDTLLDEAVRWAADQTGPISQRAVRTRFRVGRDRAVALLDHIETTRRVA